MRYQRERYNSENEALRFLLNCWRGVLWDRLMLKKQEGASGWDDPNEEYDYEARMRAAIEEKRWVDLGNLAMLRWNKD